RAAAAYLARYSGHVEAAILDSAAPLELNLISEPGRDGMAAIEGTIRACERDNACQRAFPRLRAQFDELLARLAQAPLAFELAKPWTAAIQPARLHAGAFMMPLFKASYLGSTSALIPYAIDAASRGDMRPLAGMSSVGSENSQGGIAFSLFATI